MLGMVLATVTVVVLRYAFDRGAIVLQESVMYMHGLAFMLGIPYALKADAHVRVDLVYGRLGPRARAAVNLAGHLLFLFPVSITIILFSYGYVASSWRILERSAEVGGIPGVFLLKTLIPLMAGLLLLQGVAEVGRALAVLRGNETAATHRSPADGPEV
jgi:TRAP-type mannitol/chloroaromatic compound transport system permease small subunit